MIFIHDKIYARVWKVEKFEKYISLRVSTSEKDDDGKYINSTWFPRLVGHAFNTLKDTVIKGDTIIINKCKISNENYKDNEGNTKSRFNFVVFEATLIEPKKNNETSRNTTAASAAQEQGDASKDSCPW